MLKRARFIGGQQLITTRRVRSMVGVPENGKTATTAFTASDQPEAPSELRYDLGSRSVELVWGDSEPSCDGIPYSMAQVTFQHGISPSQYWFMFAPYGAELTLPQLAPFIDKEIRADVYSVELRVFAFDGVGFDDLRQSDVLFTFREETLPLLDRVGSTGCVVSAYQGKP